MGRSHPSSKASALHTQWARLIILIKEQPREQDLNVAHKRAALHCNELQEEPSGPEVGWNATC